MFHQLVMNFWSGNGIWALNRIPRIMYTIYTVFKATKMLHDKEVFLKELRNSGPYVLWRAPALEDGVALEGVGDPCKGCFNHGASTVHFDSEFIVMK